MKNYEPKEKFVKRMQELLGSEKDVEEFFKVAKTRSKKAIRVNTLKIKPDDLIERLIEKGWEVKQVFSNYPEILVVENRLGPGELGNSKEHILGYYYVQEITSMMPVIALGLNEDDKFLDLCAAPGSKTTQACALMKNKGVVIANEIDLKRVNILNFNLQRCGVTNSVVSCHDGNELVEKLQKLGFKFNKILIDSSCSDEGNIRCNPKTFLEWSEGLLKSLSRKQKKIAGSAVELLEKGGEMIYSTCTHSPEENEEVVQYLLDNYDLEILDIKLPLKVRKGLVEWRGKKFNSDIKKAVRIYHHDNDMEGFFLCKLRKGG